MKTFVISSLGNISRSGIPGSYGNSVYNFLRNCQTVFQCCYTNLHSHQQYMRAFYMSWPILVIVILFDYSHSSMCESCGFFFFFFLAAPRGMQNLSSLIRDQTHAPCRGSAESSPLDHQGSPSCCGFDFHILMSNDIGHLLMCLLASVYLLWRIVHSNPLSSQYILVILCQTCAHTHTQHILVPSRIYFNYHNKSMRKP